MPSRTRIETPARLHFGFMNLSLARDRLYGGLGAAIDAPRTVIEVEASKKSEVTGDRTPTAAEYTDRVVDLLGVEGARVTVENRIPRHVGLGSGTQMALAVLVGVADVYGIEVDPRKKAPELGRGGRSGVGVGAFEVGGFILDAGHPTQEFTSEIPSKGNWEVPPIVTRHEVPHDWRFVVVVPQASKGKHGSEEERSIRQVISTADVSIADEISVAVTERVLPGIATSDVDEFGKGIERVDRLNGAWYSEFQDGVYRPEARPIIQFLKGLPDVKGAGQSSWGPAVYGLTTEEKASGIVDLVSDRYPKADVLAAQPDNTGHVSSLIS